MSREDSTHGAVCASAPHASTITARACHALSQCTVRKLRGTRLFSLEQYSLVNYFNLAYPWSTTSDHLRSHRLSTRGRQKNRV
jgi:hypothetical protein